MALGSNRNEYQENFLGVRLTNLPPSCTVVMKSGNLKFLEPSGPLQACNGTAFYTKTHNLPPTLQYSSVLNVIMLRDEITLHCRS